MNPFEVLGFTPGYDIAADQLARRHRELSKVLHPDKFTGSGGGERREALSRAVEVNEAFRILRDPVRRAEAIFSLAGIAVGADGTGYLADEGGNAIYVYFDLADRSGSVFPDRTLRGASTGLDAPRRLALYER